MEKAIKGEKSGRARKIGICLLLCLISAVIIFGIFYFMLWLFDVFPFSDYTDSQYDLLAQIVAYAEHFFDVMKGEASLFYSVRVGGGMDVFGTVMYCLCSPFTFLFFIFGEGNVYYAASVMLPVKLTCIAASAIVMIKVRFPDMSNLIAVPVALLYAFCGYMFVANTYINWLDFLIYMPLAVLAFGHMRRTGHVRYLALVIAGTIYACFSIACFSMLVSYPVMVAYAFLVVERGNRKEYLFRISFCYLCGILAALPIMVPSLIAYLSSGRSTGLFENLWDGISELSYYRKFTYILSDAVFVVLIAVYFIKTHFSTKESRFLGVAGLLIMMPVLVDECCLLMNMGSYLSYALRFGFLNAVYELYVSCLVLENVRLNRKSRFAERARGGANGLLPKESRGCAEAKTVRKEKTAGMSQKERKTGKHERTKAKRWIGGELAESGIFLLFLALVLLACVVIYEVFCVVSGFDGLDLSGLSTLDSIVESARDASGSFSSSFAHSTGGLEGILVLFAALVVVTVPAILLYKFRLLDSRVIYVCMAVVIFFELVFFGSQLVSGNIFNPVRYTEYNSLYEQVLETDEEKEYYYRIKDCNAYLSDNQSLITDSYSYAAFSSVIDEDNFAPNIVFGYGSNGVNTLKGRYGTVFGDCLLGYKYYFYQTGSGSTLNREYLELFAEESNFSFYKNTIVFPSAYTVSSGDMGVETDYDCYFDNMQNLYAFLGGEGDVFTTYSIPDSDISYKTVTDEETGEEIETVAVKVRLRTSGDFSFYSELPTDAGIRYFTSSYDSSYDISEVKTYTYHNQSLSSYYSMYLYSEDGYELTTEEVQEKCSIKAISVDTLTALSAKLRERACDYTIENTLVKTSYEACVTADSPGEYLFLNYLSIDGMKAYVNGREVELVENGLNMIVVPLDEGENDVEIVYKSPYMVYAGVAAIAAIIVLLVLFVITRKKEKWVKALHAPVAVLSVALAAVVVAFFMVFPTVVLCVKIVGLLL